MLNESLPTDSHSIYIQNSSQVHFDVVKDVSQILDQNISAAESSQNLTSHPFIILKSMGNCIISTLSEKASFYEFKTV